MKRTYVLKAMVLLLILAFVPLCNTITEASAWKAQHLVDDADLLEDDLEEELSERLANMSEKYGLEAVIITVEDYKTYDSSLNSSTPALFVQSYYSNKEFGMDEEMSGIILMISMEERDWHIYIQGEARVAVNDYGFEYISDRLVSRLSDDDYEGAISRYVKDLENFFKEYSKGTPYGDDHKAKSTQRIFLGFGIGIGVSLLLAVIIVSTMKSQMNTARPQNAARAYVKNGSFVLTQQQDLYLYSNMTKTPIPKQTSSGSGGGSSSGSRGGSGGGGKF